MGLRVIWNFDAGAFAQNLISGFSWAGSGDVLKVQELMHACSGENKAQEEKEDEKKKEGEKKEGDGRFLIKVDFVTESVWNLELVLKFCAI